MTDFRYALRSLLRARWFTVAAVLTFAVGIGINVAVFSVVDRLLFRPLPYGDVDSLVLMRVCDTKGECYGSFPSILAFEGRQRWKTIDGVAVAAMPTNIRQANDDPPFVMSGVSENLLRVLRVHPIVGRDFTDEDAATKQRVALLGYDTWQRRFNGAPDAVGRPLAPGPSPITIVGVLPPDFIPPTWTSVAPKWDGLVLETSGWAAIGPKGGVAVPVARLAQGATVDAARAEVDALVAALAPQLREPDGDLPIIRVDPIQQALFSRVRPQAWLIVAAAFVLLLLACANLANLLLSRGRSREQTIAIHAALGASPMRLMRAAVFESLAVCVAGAAIAILTIQSASAALLSVVPPLFARYAEGPADGRVLAVALGAAVLCAVVAAIGPALRLRRIDVLTMLQRVTGSGQRSRMRAGRSLLVVEAALGVALVLSGLLIFRSFGNLSGEDLGFQPDGLYRISMRSATPSPVPAANAVVTYEQFVDVLRGIPGVDTAAGADGFVAAGAPMRGITTRGAIRGGRYQVTAGFFETIQTKFLAGRAFTDAEVRQRARVAVISASVAKHFFPDAGPTGAVGRPLILDGEPPLTVVGIVPDHRPRHGEHPRPSLFVPLGFENSRYTGAFVRMASGRPQLPVFRQRITEQFGESIVTVTAISDGLNDWLHDARFRATLFSVLALSALILAAAGLYAVASFEVAMRRYEIGVRLSLGARAADIRRLVIFDTCRPVILGVVLGAVAAYWGEKFLKTFLYGIEPREPGMYALAVATLLATGIIAAWVPARRAARVDPVTVLRLQ